MTSRPPDHDAKALPISVKAVCFDRAGRVLLCRNRRDEWELPGGRPEAREAFETRLVREVLEETGLAVSVCQMVSEFELEVLSSRWVKIVAFGCLPNDDNMPARSDEHEAVAFVDAREIQALPLPDGYRQAIDTWRARWRVGARGTYAFIPSSPDRSSRRLCVTRSCLRPTPPAHRSAGRD
jgi:8-oxo-dGTP pyrophosphatase MutT (NUDIX family)